MMAELATTIPCSSSTKFQQQQLLTLRPWPRPRPRQCLPTNNSPPFHNRCCNFSLVCISQHEDEHGSHEFLKTPKKRRNLHVKNIDTVKKGPIGVSSAIDEVKAPADFRLPSRLRKQLQHERAVNLVPDLAPKRSYSTHKLLRVMAGKVGGRKLLSPTDKHVRPMMEVVRGAVFNMLQALGGFSAGLSGGRWLDLYSGTGSVGIEALSRGCSMAHFVENDPWIVSNVLVPNLKATSFHEQSMVHTIRVEAYLERTSSQNGDCGFFDYISVTPPYELVDYPSLLECLSRSSLIGKNTCVIVEYPLKSRNEMPDTCGMLVKVGFFLST
ncbi:hypothetical protein O6H91_01G145500 [Diphasiastrum complanatum]|uniref:Uncharacterized protein n=1 Tax=Diphasiastrum complanatum TaxID=34168 RepID=A0ACC2EX17_DIPCM|nr:hypothetical protein O6H91_01G145500 [Diphasiastrum complanatum]